MPVATIQDSVYPQTVIATVLSSTDQRTSVMAIHAIDWPIQYAYSVWRMIFSPRLPPRYT